MPFLNYFLVFAACSGLFELLKRFVIEPLYNKYTGRNEVKETSERNMRIHRVSIFVTMLEEGHFKSVTSIYPSIFGYENVPAMWMEVSLMEPAYLVWFYPTTNSSLTIIHNQKKAQDEQA